MALSPTFSGIPKPDSHALELCAVRPFSPATTTEILIAWASEGPGLQTFVSTAVQSILAALAQDRPPRYLAVSGVRAGDKALFLRTRDGDEWVAFDASGAVDLIGHPESVAAALRDRPAGTGWIVGTVFMIDTMTDGRSCALFQAVTPLPSSSPARPGSGGV